ncbi:hypothetical protein DERP_013714 [Dermatophagoides pteronyssinus]|uniref:CDGSH iron-sulfur domain-containing protein 2 homologue n=1 Tax=Dermatophagoides pteronyssinus TaxID=6956 RepID=A0ABQ8JVF9_DERPT|nr:hypothetical protein DERP_013714 [Dermatophagoides pteronyssinus]
MSSQMFAQQSPVRQYLPWICTSLAIGYAAYIHWRSRCQRKKIQINLDKKHARSCEVNIDDIDRNQKPVNNEMVSGEINFDEYEEYLIEIDEEEEEEEQDEELDADLNSNNNEQLEINQNIDDDNIVKEVKFDDKIIQIEPKLLKERRESTEISLIHQSNIVDQQQQKQSTQPLKRKRYSLKGDIDDLAFDIFCFDEMPTVRQEFIDNKTIDDDDDLNEAILDELLRRWRHLSTDLKEEYLSKAKIYQTKKKISYCRCWKSETFPLCDGVHKCHNRENDDSVGPLNLVWRDDNVKSGDATTTAATDPTHSVSSVIHIFIRFLIQIFGPQC